MARIRTIKPEFWSSEQIMECSRDARLLFVGLWNFADDAGRMAYSAKRIKAQVFPSDDLTADDIHGLITELTRNGLTLLYAVDGKEYLAITGWHNQVINRPQPSKTPPPTKGRSLSEHGTLIDGREGKGREGKGEESIKSSPVSGTARACEGQTDEAGLLRTELVKIFENANSPNPVNTDRAEVWIAQGYDPKLIAAVARDVVAKKPDLRSLNYLDNPIREAHEKRPKIGDHAPPQDEKITEPRKAEIMVRLWKKGTWPHDWGPEPNRAGCRIVPELLNQLGITPASEAAQ
jgi:hypothetical protein